MIHTNPNQQSQKITVSQLIENFEQRLNKDFVSSKNEIEAILKNVEHVTPDRAEFLTSRPWWNQAFSVFQKVMEKKFPNTHIVAMPDDDSIESLLRINSIHIPNETAKQVAMNPSACHDNCVELYRKNRSNKVYTGYALSEDGLWRHHSWIVTNSGAIIETTELRLLYLGYRVC